MTRAPRAQLRAGEPRRNPFIGQETIRPCPVTTAHEYEDLHRLVDRLSPEQVRRLRVLADTDPELHGLLDERSDGFGGDRSPDRLLALAGVWENGPADSAERHDELIRDRLTRLP